MNAENAVKLSQQDWKILHLLLTFIGEQPSPGIYSHAYILWFVNIHV